MGKIFEMAKIISGYSREEAERRYEVCRDRYTDDNVTEYKKFDMLSEAMLLSQRLMDLAKEEVKSEELSNELDMNTDAWIVPLKGDDMKYWLNKYGLRTWTLNQKPIVQAQRSYYWCDKVIIMDANRKVLNDIKFTDFIRDIYGNDNWIAELPEPGKEIKPQQ